MAFANSTQYGYGARVAPLAKMDDGLLDLVVIEGRSTVENFLRVPRLFTGGFHRTAGVTTRRITEAVVRSQARMLFHVDGEVVEGERELTARVHPGALRVRA